MFLYQNLCGQSGRKLGVHGCTPQGLLQVAQTFITMFWLNCWKTQNGVLGNVTESIEKMYSVEEVMKRVRKRCPSSKAFASFGWRRVDGKCCPSSPKSEPDYLESLLMTLMRAPFSSFSLWLSDFSSVNTFISSSISDIFRSKARLSRFSISSIDDRSEVFSCFC